MVRGTHRLGLASTCLAIGMMLMTTSPPSYAEEASASGQIEEIIVTSRRRAESQQDIPVSVTAFQLEDLERVSPRTLRDLDGLAPNVFIGINTAGPGAGAIFIRGLGYADIEKTQASAVGVVVDGLALGSSTGQLIDTFDIEQVEINRGPQGVLFGKNTTGGNIVVERIKPKLGKFGAAVSTQVGNFNERIFKGRVNIPLGETAALKLGGIKRDREGFFDNVTRGGDAGEVEYDALTASLLWQPSDSLSLQLTYDKIEDGGDILPQDPRFDGDDPFVNAADLDETQRLVNEQVGLRIVYDGEYGTFTSITGFSDSEDRVDQDFDGADLSQTAIPLARLHTLRAQEFDVFTQELRWDGIINDQLTYAFGAFYSETELDFFQGTNQVLQFPEAAALGVLGIDPSSGATCAGVGLPLNPVVPALCQIPVPPVAQTAGEDTDALGIFGSVNWRPIDKLELSFGVRVIDEERDFLGSSFGAGIPDPNDPLRGAIGLVEGSEVITIPADSVSFDETITKFTATYDIAERSNLYFSFAQGYRSGGFSIRSSTPAFNTYEPEEVDAFEIGSKNIFFDGKWLLNVAAFYTEQEGAQFSSILTDQTPGGPGTNTLINNSPTPVDIMGLEVESTVVFGPRWSFLTTIGIQDNDTEAFEISSLVVPFNTATMGNMSGSGTGCNAIENPGLFPNNCPDVTLGGNAIGRAPDFNWSATLIYSREIGRNYFQASVTGKGQDDFVIVGGATSAVPVSESGYTQIDASIRLQMPFGDAGTLNASLIGKNLGDREFREQALPLGVNGGFQGWGPPRTYALQLEWVFDPQ